MFTHENKVYGHDTGLNTTNGMLSKIETCITWAIDNGYIFDFPMNILDQIKTTGVNVPKINPDFISIKEKTIYSEKTGTFHVYNTAGILVLKKGNCSSIETTLSSGLYLVQFEGDGVKASKKIIIL
jgi:hypothetical protein